MKRIFDLFLSLLLIVIFLLPMVLIAILIRLESSGPALYWSKRIGKRDKVFKMPKFRSMKVEAPSVATHLMEDPSMYISSFGRFLRQYSIDELPQLFSILNGDMSFVGPRPALFNQDDLIQLRAVNGVNNLIPGITGWAQINGRDHLTLEQKVNLDVEYLRKKSFMVDLKIIWKTIFKVIIKDSVSH